MIDLILVSTALGAEYTLDGEVREVGRMISDFPVDAEGTQLGQGMVLEQRIRLGGQVSHNDRLFFDLAGDVLTGPVAGAEWGIPTPDDPLAIDQRRYGAVDPFSAESFTLRRAALSGYAGPLLLEGGVVTSHWGLGMVANDGDQLRLFGQTRFGDRVIRLRATTRLFDQPLYLTGAIDRVIEDDLARMVDGQRAYQALLSTLYVFDEGAEVGAYVVVRAQDEADELRETNARMADLYFDVPLGQSWVQWRVAGEVAGITGTTTRSLSYNALDALAVRSFGATGLVEMTRGPAGLMLRGGYASGDGNLDDDTSHDFTFDRDFEVGQVLFPEVMGGVNAGTYALLDDPQYSGTPPAGADAVVTEGAFQRASFLSPVLLGTPTSWLTLRTGAVLAWGTAPTAQPFYTTRAGGTPTSHHDLPTSGYHLGTELNWGAGVDRLLMGSEEAGLSGSLDVQGGHAFLSDDLAGDGPARVDLYTLAARLTW